MNQLSPRSHPVHVDVDGKSYSGSYTVQGRIITVSDGQRECSRQLGGIQAEALAMNLLREMVKAGGASSSS
jgi:hypothetical protein